MTDSASSPWWVIFSVSRITAAAPAAPSVTSVVIAEAEAGAIMPDVVPDALHVAGAAIVPTVIAVGGGGSAVVVADDPGPADTAALAGGGPSAGPARARSYCSASQSRVASPWPIIPAISNPRRRDGPQRLKKATRPCFVMELVIFIHRGSTRDPTCRRTRHGQAPASASSPASESSVPTA